MYKIGDVIENRSDGSVIYMSQRGPINVDNEKELEEERNNDESFLKEDK